MRERDTRHDDDPTGARRSTRRRALFGLAAAVAAVALLELARADPRRTDLWYSQAVYPILRGALGAVSARLPLSAAELLCLLLALAALALAARGSFRALRGRERWLAVATRGLANGACAAGVGFLLFESLWGLNHARLPLAAHLGLTVGAPDAQRLAAAARLLIADAGRDRALLGDAGTAACDPRAPGGGVDRRIHEAWATAGERHPVLAGPEPCVRLALASGLLTRSRLTGVYSPFTAEPHVNAELPPSELFFTLGHEMAHERGFAREDEANFLGYLVTSFSVDPAVRYSGELYALAALLGALSRTDRGLAGTLIAELDPRVREDLRAQEAFWARASRLPGAVQLSGVVQRANDTYLKQQGQRAGVASYGRAVELLAAHLLRDRE